MTDNFKTMAITSLDHHELKSKLGLDFDVSEDVLGTMLLAKSSNRDGLNFQIRIYQDSPKPSTEIMLDPISATRELDRLLEKLDISRNDLYWTHPRAGGTLRRHVVDTLHKHLNAKDPLIQVVLGPRQVGKTTAVKHLIKEWKEGTHYATADAVVDEFGPWLEKQWQDALTLGEGTLLVIDEIQRVKNWSEIVKRLWDATKIKGLRVVLLGSTSLSHLLSRATSESLTGRFNPIYVPHWSYLETKEAFGTDIAHYVLFGGYPKAMEFCNSKSDWFDYVGKSIINPIIDIDIFQQGNFKNIENLRRAFKVFCREAGVNINYTQLLREIQHTGNVEIVKRYLSGYYETFLMKPIRPIDDNGNEDTRKNPGIVLSCPAVFTFGRSNADNDLYENSDRFEQSVISETSRIPHTSFGYWKQGEDIGMDLYLRTLDNQVFGLVIEGSKSFKKRTESYDRFRKTFKNARIATISRNNFSTFLKGHRAFLESSAI